MVPSLPADREWTVNWAPFESIHGEHAVSGFVLCLIYHFTLQIEALCLYTFHPVLSTTVGLSGRLITAAINQRNQSVNHCESQTVWGNDSKVLKPKSPLFVSHVFLAVVGEESATCALFCQHCCLLSPGTFYYTNLNWDTWKNRKGGGGGMLWRVSDACNSPLTVVNISTCINCIWIVCSFTPPK